MFAFSSNAQVKLARLFSDHVVLQRQKPIPIWGWAKVGEKVTISLANQTQTAQTDANGKWQVTFPPMEASNVGYTLKATAQAIF
jgi:sialate O-acetylesterase